MVLTRTGDAGVRFSCLFPMPGLRGDLGERVPCPLCRDRPMATSQPVTDEELFSLSASGCCEPNLCFPSSSMARGFSPTSSAPPGASVLWTPVQAPSPQTWIRPLFAAGFSSDTQPQAPSTSRQQASPLAASRRRLARRSGGEGAVPWRGCGLWGHGLSTFLRGGVRGSAGDPGVRESHWRMEALEEAEVVGGFRGGVKVLGPGVPEVLEGRGRSPLLGAQAAGCGEDRGPRLSVRGLLDGVTSHLLAGPGKQRRTWWDFVCLFV